jgi:hypothetical protein
MSEKVIGSIYPAALVAKTPLFGNVYMPYRLIFTSERVIAFYPDAKKAFRSGIKLFKAYEYRGAKWKRLLDEAGSGQVVHHGSEGVSDEMLKADGERGYGSLAYTMIGGVVIRAGAREHEFNILFRPADKALIRGLEFCTARSALVEAKALLGKTELAGKVEARI